jgi:hypothetical protein
VAVDGEDGDAAGITMMMIHAPSVNFVTANTTATMAVSTAPTPLATILRRQRVVTEDGPALVDLGPGRG